MAEELVGEITLAKLLELIKKQKEIGASIRLHPNGFLQLPLSIGKDQKNSTLRLHLWSEELESRGEEIHKIHDHIFDIDSYILIGSLKDQKYKVSEDPNGDFIILKSDGKGDLNPTKEKVSCQEESFRIIKQGNKYTIPKGEFHKSNPNDKLVLTLMQKSNLDLSLRSRVIAPNEKNYKRIEIDRSIDQDFAWNLIIDAINKIHKE